RQSACDVGTRQTASAKITQIDGHLRVDLSNTSLAITHMEGGIWHDGRFDVGGYSTKLGGAVQITARSTGTASSPAGINGTLSAHGRGSVQGDHLDCFMSVSIAPGS